MLTSSDLSTSLILQGSWIQRRWRSAADSFHMGLATAVGYQAQAVSLLLGYHQPLILSCLGPIWPQLSNTAHGPFHLKRASKLASKLLNSLRNFRSSSEVLC